MPLRRQSASGLQTVTWTPDQPNVVMHRSADGKCRAPGDFVFLHRDPVDRSLFHHIGPADGRAPTHIKFKNNRGEYHMVAIRPVKQENGASWEWDGNWEQPTLQPSILSSCHDPETNETEILWHGFVRAGVIGFEC